MSARALMLGIVLSAGLARAQSTAADRETARSLMDAGDRSVEARDDAGALRSYRAADSMMHVPTTGIEVAKVLARLGQLVEAREQALAVTRLPKGTAEPAAFVQARAEAERLAGSLSSRIPTLTLRLNGLGTGQMARVMVDGEIVPLEAQSLPRRVDPGLHRVVASAERRGDVSSEVVLAEGQAVRLDLAFAPLPAAPWATIPSEPPRPPPVQSRSPTLATWIALGAGGAGLLAGAVGGVVELSQASTLKSRCAGTTCLPSDAATLSSVRTLAAIVDVALALGAAGVVTGAVLYLTTPSRSVAPQVGFLPGGGTLGLGAAF